MQNAIGTWEIASGGKPKEKRPFGIMWCTIKFKLSSKVGWMCIGFAWPRRGPVTYTCEKGKARVHQCLVVWSWSTKLCMLTPNFSAWLLQCFPYIKLCCRFICIKKKAPGNREGHVTPPPPPSSPKEWVLGTEMFRVHLLATRTGDGS
jgi:hypothetical protein